MLIMDRHAARPPNIIIGDGEPFGPNRFQLAIDHQQLPSSPLDEIGFKTQINNTNNNTNNKENKHEQEDISTKSLTLNETKALDSLIGLDRRFSMVSIESSATTGRLLDHLGLDEEEEIDWAKYNENAFKNKTDNNNVKNNNENNDNNNNNNNNNGHNNGLHIFHSNPIHAINESRGLNQNNTWGNRNQMLKAQMMDKRLPATPPPLHHHQQQQQQQQRKPQNYAPADKFPSLQRRFLKAKTNETQPQVQQQPQSEQSSPRIRKPEIATKEHTSSGPISILKTKNLILHPSPISTPRKFAKDFSDQFERTPPQRRESPQLDSKTQFNISSRPKHIHSFSNPVNHVLSTPRSANGTPGPTTPSPKRSLQRTPSTPVPRRTGSTKKVLDIDRLIFAKPDEINPELRVKLAIELKRKNQPQEASYQLQLAAEAGNKDAMLLYGLSLRYGYGVKKDDRQSLLWLCRAADIDLIRSFKFEVDPFELSDYEFPSKPQEPLTSTLLEIGKAYMNGWGVERDENYGIQFIEKSASLGFAEAMLEAGNIWSTKGPNRKKNMHRSASWYRLADKFGKKLVGNSWIYKSKYMEKV